MRTIIAMFVFAALYAVSAQSQVNPVAADTSKGASVDSVAADTSKAAFIVSLDKQIAERELGLARLLSDIEQAKQRAIYVQGGIDELKRQRHELSESMKVPKK